MNATIGISSFINAPTEAMKFRKWIVLFSVNSRLVYKFTSLFNKHSLHDIHGIMSIIYKQVIEVNIEAKGAYHSLLSSYVREFQLNKISDCL